MSEKGVDDASLGMSLKSFHQTADWQVKLYAPGGRLNKKDGLTRYGNSHVKDKTS